MITNPVRISYVNVLKPKEDLSGNLRYGCRVLIPKEDEALLKSFEAAVHSAKKAGIEKGKFTKAQANGPKFKTPLRDGDVEFKAEIVKSPEHKGHMFFNCSSFDPVGIVNVNGSPITTSEEIYSGCWARLDLSFYPFNSGGSMGVAVGLNNLLKVKDDDRLDGRQNAAEAFKDYFEGVDENSEMM